MTAIESKAFYTEKLGQGDWKVSDEIGPGERGYLAAMGLDSRRR